MRSVLTRLGRAVAPVCVVLAIGGVATPVAYVPAAHADIAQDPDVNAAHLLTLEFDGAAADDWDFGDDLEFEVPLAFAPARRVHLLDLHAGPVLTLGGQIHQYLYPNGTQPNGLVHGWGAGPFPLGGGLFRDADVALCFKQQRATVTLRPGNRIEVAADIGLVVHDPACGGALNVNPSAQGRVSVVAPADGRRVCGTEVRLERGGDWVSGQLCATNQRVDPRPIAATPVGNGGAAPFTLSLDGSPSVVPNGVHLWHWDFGDGQTAVAGPRVTHTYPSPGRYPVTLRITDNLGITREAGVMTAVVHPPTSGPVARISAGSAVHAAGDPVTLSAAASTPGSGRTGVIIEYWWDTGDGTQVITRVPDAEITHVYGRAGVYTARVTVYTGDLRTSTATTTLIVGF
jgi:hypothetical protein